MKRKKERKKERNVWKDQKWLKLMKDQGKTKKNFVCMIKKLGLRHFDEEFR